MTIHPDVVVPRGAEALFRSLSDPSRLAIISCLAHGERRVADLMDEVGLSQSTVSEHVACLKDCGLVQGRPEGRQIFYALSGPEVLTLLEAAAKVLEATGHAIDECPVYGRTARTAARKLSDDHAPPSEHQDGRSATPPRRGQAQ